jgi:predicted Zn-dependent protease with MMP-like domain
MDRQRFQELVERAVAHLPPFFQEKMENIAIVVEDEPPAELASEYPGQLLLGLYRGVPLPERSVWSFHPYPDLISIYQRNIERLCRTEEEIVEQVRETVMHEIGHYFGMDEEQLRELGLG